MVVTFLLMLAVGLIVAIFRSEFEAWMPWIAERLRRAALKPLSGPLRERFDEEWSSHLGETPGYLGKVVAALGFNWAARQISMRRAFHRAGYRGTVFAAMTVRRAGRFVMNLSSVSDYFPVPKGARDFVGFYLAKYAFLIAMIALFIMHERVKFVEDEEHRARMEKQQLEELDVLIEKVKIIAQASKFDSAIDS